MAKAHKSDESSSRIAESWVANELYKKMGPTHGKMEELQTQIYEYVLKRSKEKRTAVDLSEIQQQFDFQTNLVVFQAIVDLYDAGKLHEVRMHQYLPRQF